MSFVCADQFKSACMCAGLCISSHKDFSEVVRRCIEVLPFHWVGREVNLTLQELSHTEKIVLTHIHCPTSQRRLPLWKLEGTVQPVLYASFQHECRFRILPSLNCAAEGAPRFVKTVTGNGFHEKKNTCAKSFILKWHKHTCCMSHVQIHVKLFFLLAHNQSGTGCLIGQF